MQLGLIAGALHGVLVVEQQLHARLLSDDAWPL
jgi:hypothetical protein